MAHVLQGVVVFGKLATSASKQSLVANPMMGDTPLNLLALQSVKAFDFVHGVLPWNKVPRVGNRRAPASE